MQLATFDSENQLTFKFPNGKNITLKCTEPTDNREYEIPDLGTNGVFTLSGTTTSLSTNLVPLTNNTYDIGTSTLNWRNIYLSNTLNTANINNTANDLNITTTTSGDIILDSVDTISFNIANNPIANVTNTGLEIVTTSNQMVMGTSNLTTLSFPSPSSSITLTFPNSASDTIVARNTSDTLTNKILSNPSISGTVSLTSATTFLNTVGDTVFEQQEEFTSEIHKVGDNQNFIIDYPSGTNIFLADNVSVNIGRDTNITSTTDSTSSSTGSLIVSGGVGIAKSLYVGSGIYLPTSGSTASLLDYYEEGEITNSWQGCIASTDSNIFFVRIGKLVTLHFSGIATAGNNTSNSINNGSSLLPTRLRPKFALACLCQITNANSAGVGYARFLTGGNIAISSSSTTFASFTASTDNHGFGSFVVSYTIN